MTLLAPGNFARANGNRYNEFYSKSMIKRLLDNLNSIIDINIGPYNWIFIFLLSVLLGIAVAIYAKKKWICIVSCIFSMYFILEQTVSISNEFRVFLRVVWIIYYFSILFWYYFKQKKYVFLSLLISGVMSQGMMIISPVVPLRSHTMMEFMLHILFVDCIISIYNNLDLKRLEKTLYIICLTMTCIYSTHNLMITLTGYKSNYEINQINHYKLVETHKKYLSGCKLTDVILYKLCDDRYAHDMPYHLNSKYIEEWMKSYYELPDELIFNWFDISKDYVFELIDGEYYDDHWMGKGAIFRLQTYEEQILNLSIINPLDIKNQQIRCEIAGNEYIFDIVAGEKKNVEFVIPSGENILLIQAMETFIPSNGDTRALSVIVENVK